jgi:uncharacterized protein
MPERLLVPVRVIPRAGADRVDGMRAGRWVLRVTAAPESGAANRAAQELLAAALGLRPAELRLERGSASRDKIFSIPTYAQAALSDISKSKSGAGGGTAQGIARDARVPRGPSAATAPRSRRTGEGARSERSRSRDRTPGAFHWYQVK